jgi:hypothetical protein
MFIFYFIKLYFSDISFLLCCFLRLNGLWYEKIQHVSEFNEALRHEDGGGGVKLCVTSAPDKGEWSVSHRCSFSAGVRASGKR